MQKRLILAVCFTMVFGVVGTASATKSRTDSLGGGVKDFTVLDDRNIFHLPSEIIEWAGWAAIETNGNWTSFGFHYRMNKSTVFALYGSSMLNPAINLKDLDQSGNSGFPTAANFPNNGDDSGHKVTAFFGKRLGTLKLGFKLGIWGDRADSVAVNDDETSGGPLVIDFGAGVGFPAGAGDVDIALDVRFGTPGDEQPADGAGSEGKQIDVGLLFRGAFPFSGRHQLVPFAGLDVAFGDSALLQDGTPDFSAMEFGLQAGMDFRLRFGEGDDITVQPGFGLAFSQYSHTTTPSSGDDTIVTNKDIAAFYNLAVDVKVADWCDIRFGGGQRLVWNLDGTEQGDNESSTTTADVQHHISSGVGFNLAGGVQIDIDVNTGWWQKGPYFLTGDGGPGAFGASAAISKDW